MSKKQQKDNAAHTLTYANTSVCVCVVNENGINRKHKKCILKGDLTIGKSQTGNEISKGDAIKTDGTTNNRQSA